MRLLLVAPVCDSEATGEAWIAYQWVSRLAQRHDVTVLTYHQRGKRPLSRQLTGTRVVEWPEPPVIGRFERFNAMLNPGYLSFHWRARRWIRGARRRGEIFDLGHQVSPVSVRYASPLAGSGIPYVLGPVGGGLKSPEAFRREEGGAPWFTALRVLDNVRLRWDPLLRHSFSGAACVIGIADYVRDLLGPVRLQSFRAMSDTGIERLPPAAPGSGRIEAVRLLFVGRVIRTKGVRDAIRAVSHLPRGMTVLDVVGDGYDRSACEALVAELDLGDAVRFHGHVPHGRVADFYLGADVFVFPSYREAGGIVVIEAMSYGLPVIVVDRGGPASAVDDASGLRVPAHDPEQLARDLSRAIAALAADPARRVAMGRAGRARTAETGLWDSRIHAIERLYMDFTCPTGGDG